MIEIPETIIQPYEEIEYVKQKDGNYKRVVTKIKANYKLVDVE